VQNWQGDGTPTTNYTDQNVTVETTYTPDSQVSTYTAVNPTTGNQMTQYAYGTTLADSGVARTDLLRAVIYPDSANTFTISGGVPVFSDGSGGYDRVEYRYDRLGEQTQVKDQNQTVHDYIFDKLGRAVEDDATAGTGVDATAAKILYGYEVRGMLNKVTSKKADNSVVNEVFRQFNDWGQLAREYQSHDDVVNTSTTPHVDYGYADGSGNTIRATSMTYPNGRVLTYGYNSGNDDALGRVSYLADSGGTHLVDYSYLGLNLIIGTANVQPGITGGVTLDQFGRVANVTASASVDLINLNYGYDRASNRTYRQDAKAEAVGGSGVNLDEVYSYDLVNQLKSAVRGHWSNGNPQTGTFVADTGGLSQSWTLDATGNWSSVTTGTATPQTRTANAANEITGIDSSAANVRYDLAGNMTVAPQPNSPTAGYNLTYDAWNRLVKVTTGSGVNEKTVAEYGYDGLNHRVVKETYDSSGVLSETRHFYLSQGDQVLEERVGTSVAAAQQYVWGLRYVDDLVLRDWDVAAGGDLGGDGNANNGTTGLDERLYAMQDANWNVVALVNTSGVPVERYTYSAYGKVEVRNADFSEATGNASAYAWTVLYTGRDLDMETGFQYNRARYYDADLGRFVGRDPIGYAADINLYRYVYNSPVIFVDPTGLAWYEFTAFGQNWTLDPMDANAGGFCDTMSAYGSAAVLAGSGIGSGATAGGATGAGTGFVVGGVGGLVLGPGAGLTAGGGALIGGVSGGIGGGVGGLVTAWNAPVGATYGGVAGASAMSGLVAGPVAGITGPIGGLIGGIGGGVGVGVGGGSAVAVAGVSIGVNVPAGVAVGAVYGTGTGIVYSQGHPTGRGVSSSYRRPGQKPTNAPPGTRPIDQHPCTKDIVHEIKRGLKPEGVGPDSYVGVSPDGEIIVTNPNGKFSNLGPWSSYAH